MRTESQANNSRTRDKLVEVAVGGTLPGNNKETKQTLNKNKQAAVMVAV
jgi:hypothetical protein